MRSPALASTLNETRFGTARNVQCPGGPVRASLDCCSAGQPPESTLTRAGRPPFLGISYARGKAPAMILSSVLLFLSIVVPVHRKNCAYCLECVRAIFRCRQKRASG